MLQCTIHVYSNRITTYPTEGQFHHDLSTNQINYNHRLDEMQVMYCKYAIQWMSWRFPVPFHCFHYVQRLMGSLGGKQTKAIPVQTEARRGKFVKPFFLLRTSSSFWKISVFRVQESVMGGDDHCAVLGCDNDRWYPERHVGVLRFYSPRTNKEIAVWEKQLDFSLGADKSLLK